MSKPVNQTPDCYDCTEGTMSKVVEDYTMELSDGHILTVPNLPYIKCNKCDTEILPPDSCQKIEDAIEIHKPGHFKRY